MSASFRIDGQVALVTGGAGGIGEALARRFVDAGARVVLADLDVSAAGRVAAAVARGSDACFALGADVTDQASVDAMVAEAIARFGQIDILVNNAGIMGRSAPLWELQDEDWRRVLDTDLTSVFRVSRAVIAHMRARRSGAIVSVASIAGKEGTPRLIPYSVAKAGIIAFTKALGREVIGDGVRVNCVAPAVVKTALLEQLPAEAVEAMLVKAPMGRLGTADEVAAVVQFLASPAASFVTAQCFDASGGRATY